MKWD
jgi:hypothetical protein